MAVTITADAVRDALRLGDSVEEADEVTRLLATATALIQERAPDAPDAVANEAAIRLCAFLYDKPNYSERVSSLWRNSGAGELLLQWLSVRGTIVGAD